jgi:CRISP-associated protein Cas1
MDGISSDSVVVRDSGGELLPVRMLNEFVYCPRLFYFMHVEQKWEDNVFTLEGKEAHRRVDRIDQLLPDPEPLTKPDANKGDPVPRVARSVSLSSPKLGLTAKLDLVSVEGDIAVPVDTKRGRVPGNAERSWEPERVQLMAQGLLLREHGYKCSQGVLYFAESRTRVPIVLDGALEQSTLAYIAQARDVATRREMPPPLEDSPKCNGCSLSGICLPDETSRLRQERQHADADADAPEPELRRLYPPRDFAVPFYVQEQGARVGKRGEQLTVHRGEEQIGAARTKDVSQLVLLGGVSLSAQTLHHLCDEGIPVVHLSRGHWFYGITSGIGLRNAYDRAAQYAAAADSDRSLEFARQVVAGKAANQRTLLGRNVRPRPDEALRSMAVLLRKVPGTASIDALRGLEGGIAAHYFRCFGQMLRPRDFDAAWDFSSRNRRPPQDPVNAMLSFGYALLAKECTVALLAEGLDPYWGLYHHPRHGRPALALDLMEEFRPLIVDSAVITAINTGMVSASSFQRTAAACVLNADGRKAFLRAYEARMDQMVTHPMFGYQCAWRTVIRVQARLLSRWLRGDIPSYEAIRTR